MLPSLSCIPEHDASRHVNIDELDPAGELHDARSGYVDGNIDYAVDFETLGDFEADTANDVGEVVLDALSLSDSDSDEIIEIAQHFSKSTDDFTNLLYRWEFKETGRDFDDLSDLLRIYSHPDKISFPDAEARVRGGSSRIWFEATDIALLAPGNWLNGSCINQLGTLLQERFDKSNRCALFSTYALDRFYPEGQNGVEEFIRYHRRLDYANRSLWLVPINRKSPARHWVLSCVDLESSTIYHFDSLAVKRTWQEDVDVSRFLMNRFVWKLLYVNRMFGNWFSWE
jgi:hypothetical protein